MHMLKKDSIIKELEDKCRAHCIPHAVLMELTYRCNLSCKHCFVVDEHRTELSLEKIKDILAQLVEAGTFYVGWTGGEIFLRNDIIDILEYAKKKGFFQIILTNGTLINKETAEFLKEIKPSSIEISLLGATAETHDSITRVPGSFNKAVETIAMLIERKLPVVTKTTLMNLNVAEYAQIKSLAKDLGAVSKITAGVLPRIDGAAGPHLYRITGEDREKYLQGNLLDEDFIQPDENQQGSLTCKAGKALASINPYGDVSPCVILPIRLGNLCERSFKEIWYDSANGVLAELRSLSKKDLLQCSACQLASLCVRCTGAAYLEHNSITAPFSCSCEEALWKKTMMLKKEGHSSQT